MAHALFIVFFLTPAGGIFNRRLMLSYPLH
jgi:hypothetical protein